MAKKILTALGGKKVVAVPGNWEPKTLAALSKKTDPIQVQNTAVGRHLKVPILGSGSGSPSIGNMCTPYTIPAGYANAFYVEDSPVPLRIKSDISSDALYAMQMGECFQGSLGSLTIDGFGYNPGNASDPINIPSASTTTPLFVAKLWVGTYANVGVIDKRTQPSTTWKERMVQALPASGVVGTQVVNSVAANTLQAFTTTTITQQGPQTISQFQPVKEWLISNLDTANIIYACDYAGNALVPIFPQSTVRIPAIGLFGSSTFDNFSMGAINVYNNNGAAVLCIITAIVNTTGQEFESQ